MSPPVGEMATADLGPLARGSDDVTDATWVIRRFGFERGLGP